MRDPDRSTPQQQKVVGAPVTASRHPEEITVVLASPRSFCAGVERAIEAVEAALVQYGEPVYVRKQVVHNSHVVAELARGGARFVEELDEVPDGSVVLFSAHGVSLAVREEALRRGLTVVDATCPLVSKVHTAARRSAARGETVVLVGHAGHEEVEGTIGNAPDATVLVETVEDVAALSVADPSRISYLTQTTLAVDETEDVLAALRERFPQVAGPGSNDICYATTNRQEAVAAVADVVDLVLVLGSPNSSNSVRLVEVARRRGTAAHLVDDVSGIDPRWLSGVRAVGLSAGASAPERLVAEIVDHLSQRGPVTVREHVTGVENVRFTPAKPVRANPRKPDDD